MNNDNKLYNGYIFDYSKKYGETMDESFYPTILIENHSSKCRGLLYNKNKIIKTRKYPLKVDMDENNALIFNWNDIECIYGKIFEDLKVDPNNHNIVISDSLNNNYMANRGKMAQILFETFQIKGLFFIRKPILLHLLHYEKHYDYSSSGIVINIGKFETSITPILDHTILPTASWKIKMDGNIIRKNMNDESISNLLSEFIVNKTIGIIKKLDVEIREEISQNIFLYGGNMNLYNKIKKDFNTFIESSQLNLDCQIIIGL